MQKYSLLIILFIFFHSTEFLFAQKDQIPLEPQLENNSERQLIKIGMITASKPAKLKFGSYSNDNRKGESLATGDDTNKLLFSFDLKNNKGDIAKVEASGAQENDAQGDISVYITTSIDQDDLWVLLVGKSTETNDLSLKNIFLTNGTEEIQFNLVVGEPTNKAEVTAPKGIQASIDDYPIAAMQHYSGGSFSYKKFIWISDKTEPQLQLVMAAVFSSLLEIGAYFDGTDIKE